VAIALAVTQHRPDYRQQMPGNRYDGLAERAPMAAGGVVDALPPSIPLKQMAMWEEMQPEEELDTLYDEAVDLVRRQSRASISMLQRRLRIGHTHAARLIESMQAKGIVGHPRLAPRAWKCWITAQPRLQPTIRLSLNLRQGIGKRHFSMSRSKVMLVKMFYRLEIGL